MVILNFIDYKKISNKLFFIGKVCYPDEVIFYKNSNGHTIAHRYYGPAIMWTNKFKATVAIKRWFLNGKSYGNSGKNYNQKQFIKDVNKSWLL